MRSQLPRGLPLTEPAGPSVDLGNRATVNGDRASVAP